MRDAKIGMLSLKKASPLDFQEYNHFKYYVSVKSKLQHPPPPPAIPRAFDTLPVPGRREFDYQSLSGCGEFDPHALGVGNLNCTPRFHVKSVAWRASMYHGGRGVKGFSWKGLCLCQTNWFLPYSKVFKFKNF